MNSAFPVNIAKSLRILFYRTSLVAASSFTEHLQAIASAYFAFIRKLDMLDILTLYCIISQIGQAHFKNLAAFAARVLKCV